MQTIFDFIVQNWIFLSILVGSLLAILFLYYFFNLRTSDRPMKVEETKPLSIKKETIPLGDIDSHEPVQPIIVGGEIIAKPISISERQPSGLEEIPSTNPSDDISITQPDIAIAKEPVEAVNPKPKKTLGRYHVLFRSSDSTWIVKREGSDRILRVLETQKDAIAFANIKALSNDTLIVIHKKDGKIRKQNYRKGDED